VPIGYPANLYVDRAADDANDIAFVRGWLVSPASGFRVEPATLAQRCDRIEAALVTLSEQGLRVHPASRIPRYILTIRRFVEVGRRPADYSPEEFQDIAVAILETGEIFYALDLLMREPRVAGWLPVMRKVVKGSYASTDAADQARDAQFELLAAASCRVAGAEPEFAEPDIRVRVERRRLLIAAKRLSSLRSLENRVREARSQIDGTIAPVDQGLIAIDLTPALGLADRIHRLRDAGEIRRLHSSTYSAINNEGRRVGEWASVGGGRSVRATAAYARLGAVLVSENVFAEIRPWWSGPVPAFAPTAAPLIRFLRRLGTLGSENRARI
jgi:hypothetical protein